MNIRLILRALGLVLLCEAAAMVPSLLMPFYYGESDWLAFLASLAVTALAGGLLSLLGNRKGSVGYREGFAVAAFGWMLLAVFGSLPYLFSGVLTSPVDAFFETMSGFTTTGASVIADVEILPHGILLWRSLTHWLGGMGIIVLTVALIPSLKIAGLQMFKAEVPGPTKSKVLPRIAQTSRELYKIYVLLTVSMVILLKLAGMNWFDSLIHTFGTVATGGFSSRNASIAAYDSLLVEGIIIFFMILSGINFALHYFSLRGNFRPTLKDPEVRLYLGIIGVSVCLITVNLVFSSGYGAGAAVRQSFFQVASIMTTTGYATADFDQWPSMSKMVLLVLMFVGGCAGSTGGGIKVSRILILIKGISRQIMKLLHPQAVLPLRVGKNIVSNDVLDNVQTFFFLYILILGTAVLFVTSQGIDLMTSISAVAATLGNVGPGFGAVGPMTNFFALPASVKVVLSLCMLIGRLEIYTILVILSTRFWRS
ncbi:MAG: potassium transporter [Peptococcaceae bacterium BICA1-7]|nr:MAG: potassium transporter [Peptococcaceae bacterium BICA1-7]HBV97059.1 TrkH family potassium uptake protein [Desulfotomaculum sp.]